MDILTFSSKQVHEKPRYPEKSHPGNRPLPTSYTSAPYSNNAYQGNNDNAVTSSVQKANPSDNSGISNWQPMPQNPPPAISSYSGGWQKDDSGSSWGDPSGNVSGFQPIDVKLNNPNALTNMPPPQVSQEPFSIGEWSAPADSSSKATVSESQQVQSPGNEQEEDLHQQWLEVQRNWRESSVQSGNDGLLFFIYIKIIVNFSQ